MNRNLTPAPFSSEGTPFENLAGDYPRVLEIEDAIYRSAATGRKVDL